MLQLMPGGFLKAGDLGTFAGVIDSTIGAKQVVFSNVGGSGRLEGNAGLTYDVITDAGGTGVVLAVYDADGPAIINVTSAKVVNSQGNARFGFNAGGSATQAANTRNFAFNNANGAGGGAVNRFIIQSRNDDGSYKANLFYIEHSGNIKIGGSGPTAKLHIDQESSSGAKPVLRLDQADIDDTFIDFIGTSAADGSRSISSVTTELATKFGAFRVEINGVTKWVRVYDASN